MQSCACLGILRAIGLLARESDSQIAVHKFVTALSTHLEGLKSAARALVIKRECFQWWSGVESWTDTNPPRYFRSFSTEFIISAEPKFFSKVEMVLNNRLNFFSLSFLVEQQLNFMQVKLKLERYILNFSSKKSLRLV